MAEPAQETPLVSQGPVESVYFQAIGSPGKTIYQDAQGQVFYRSQGDLNRDKAWLDVQRKDRINQPNFKPSELDYRYDQARNQFMAAAFAEKRSVKTQVVRQNQPAPPAKITESEEPKTYLKQGQASKDLEAKSGTAEQDFNKASKGSDDQLQNREGSVTSESNRSSQSSQGSSQGEQSKGSYDKPTLTYEPPPEMRAMAAKQARLDRIAAAVNSQPSGMEVGQQQGPSQGHGPSLG